jgi:amino acid transporter
VNGSQPAARPGGVAVPRPARPTAEPPSPVGAAAAAGPALRPHLGLVGLTFVSLGSIIGSGWLLGALTAAKVAGPASLIAWALAGILIIGLALVHAELGAAYPVAGGTARYTHLALGPLSGFVAAWLAWVQAAALAPIEAEAALSYLNNVWPGLVSPHGTLTGRGLALGAAALGLCTVVNVMGVHRLADTNAVAVIWKFLVPVLTVATLLAVAFHPSNFHAGGGFAPFGARGVFAALPAGVVFALQGFEQAVQMGAEARDPGRDVPRAVILATLLGTAVYLLLALAFLGALDPGAVAGGWSHPVGQGNYGPYATIATGLGLTWLAVLLYIDAVVSPGGTALIYVGTSARLAYSMGQTGYLPGVLRRLDRRGTPVVGILLAFVIGLVMFLPFPSWQELVTLISSATFLTYAFAPIALAVLRRADGGRPRPYRLPAAGLLARLAFATSNLIVYWAGWHNNQRLAAAVVAGLALFAVYRATSRAGRPALEWRAALWMLPWLGGLTVISWLGQFGGGRGVIPFWIDLAVVLIFSLAIFEVALRAAPPLERSRQLVTAELAPTGLGDRR